MQALNANSMRTLILVLHVRFADMLMRARRQHDGVRALCAAIFDVRRCVCRPEAAYTVTGQNPWVLPPAPRRLPQRSGRLLPLLQKMMGASFVSDLL